LSDQQTASRKVHAIRDAKKILEKTPQADDPIVTQALHIACHHHCGLIVF
jgi:hypothetical protein